MRCAMHIMVPLADRMTAAGLILPDSAMVETDNDVVVVGYPAPRRPQAA